MSWLQFCQKTWYSCLLTLPTTSPSPSVWKVLIKLSPCPPLPSPPYFSVMTILVWQHSYNSNTAGQSTSRLYLNLTIFQTSTQNIPPPSQPTRADICWRDKIRVWITWSPPLIYRVIHRHSHHWLEIHMDSRVNITLQVQPAILIKLPQPSTLWTSKYPPECCTK